MISGQYSNQLVSSLLLYLEHKLLKKGGAFQNISSTFYDVSDYYTNIYAYSAPYQPAIADSSIPGATIMTGIYLNSSFLTTGTSGFYDIDYARNILYFTQPVTGTITGTYALADFNFSLSSEPEENLLFETKYRTKPRISQPPLSGLDPQTRTLPIIYLKDNGGENKEFSFGGNDLTINNARALVLAESQYELDAVLSIFKDLKNTNVPLIGLNEYPYNLYGGLKSGIYNYTGFVASYLTNNQFSWIDSVYISKFNQNIRSEVGSINNPNIYVGFVDFVVSSLRSPRQ